MRTKSYSKKCQGAQGNGPGPAAAATTGWPPGKASWRRCFWAEWAPCGSRPRALAPSAMTPPIAILGVAEGYMPDLHCFHGHSLFPGCAHHHPPPPVPAPALPWQPQVQTEPGDTWGQDCVERCPWPKPVASPLPPGVREGELGVQVSDDELDADQETPSFGGFSYRDIQLCSATPLSLKISSFFFKVSREAYSLQEIIAGFFPLESRAQSIVGPLILLRVILFPSYRITPTLTSVKALSLTSYWP